MCALRVLQSAWFAFLYKFLPTPSQLLPFSPPELLPYLVACVAAWELHAPEGGGAGAAAQVYQSVLRALSEGPFAGPSAAEERLWVDFAATMADCCWAKEAARPALVHAALSQVMVFFAERGVNFIERFCW